MKFASFAEPIAVLEEDSIPSERGFLFIVKDAAGVHILVNGEPEDNALTITDQDLQQFTKYIIFNSPLKGLQLVNHDDMFRSKDQWAFRSKTEILSKPIANLYFHDTWENSIFFSNTPPVSTEEFDVVNHNTYVHDWFATQYPEGEYHVAHNTNLRMDIFRGVNTIDSLVALEQQVDLLQKLVVSLIQGDPLPAWAGDFMSGIEAQSCTNLRDYGELVADCVEHKGKVRDAQSEYFMNRLTRV